MSGFTVGNLTNLSSIDGLHNSINEMIFRLEDTIDRMNSTNHSILTPYFEEMLLKIKSVKSSIPDMDKDIIKSFRMTFKDKSKGDSADFSVRFSLEDLEKNDLLFISLLKRLNIKLISGIREHNLLVKIKNSSFNNFIINMGSEPVLIEGKDILVRDKYIIKPAQPGRESISEFTPISNVISVFVERAYDEIPEKNMHDLTLFVSKNEFFSLDNNGNVHLTI